jgi:folate-binding protein YgfZ
MSNERDSLLADYARLAAVAAVAALPGRTQIEVRGGDRSTFLHGMCTNDVKQLAAGRGREAFFTNVQGKTIGHALLFAGADALTIDATPGQAAVLIPALDRYIIREDVQLTDRTDELAELLIAGPEAASLVAQLSGGDIPSERLDHVAAAIAAANVSLRRVDFLAGDCFFVSCAAERVADVRAAIEAAGANPIGGAAVDAARIEQGTPLFGRDIAASNLPQEVARDAQAIHLNKGCYLGQETIARIDALGHVNRYLVGVQFEGDVVPKAGTELRAGDKVVGEVTSAAFSPRLNAPLALAYVRRGHHEPGTVLTSDIASAKVVKLPVVTVANYRPR